MFNYTKIIIAETSKSWNHFDVSDIDGDTDLDILVSEQGSIEIYYNDGNENFSPTYINANSLSSNIIAGDFDANGYVDFISTSRGQNGPIRFWKNILNIGFQLSTVTNVEITTGDILVNDIDNDGNGNFSEQQIQTGNVTNSGDIFTIQDFDDDGDIDIISSNNKFPFTIWNNTSNIPLSIENQEEVTANIRIYPNPTSDAIRIESNDIIIKAGLYNLQGQKINNPLLNNNIDLRNLVNGMYILKLKTKGKSMTFKIIKR